MAELTRDQLIADANTFLPDNEDRVVSVGTVRQRIIDSANSHPTISEFNEAVAGIATDLGTGVAAQVAAVAQLAGRSTVANANYTALRTDAYIGFTTLTATRTITLPAASSYKPGQTLYIADETGNCNAQASTPVLIIIAAAGSDTIAGQASISMGSPYQKLAFHTNGSNLWTV